MQRWGVMPSQSPAVTAPPEGEPRGARREFLASPFGREAAKRCLWQRKRAAFEAAARLAPPRGGGKRNAATVYQRQSEDGEGMRGGGWRAGVVAPHRRKRRMVRVGRDDSARRLLVHSSLGVAELYASTYDRTLVQSWSEADASSIEQSSCSDL